ncbi:MAG: leucyl aminopeptidase, partial [Chloroflexi bacterium]|nr:leucyl aminopeptidase [Chloroflexota bacterium]
MKINVESGDITQHDAKVIIVNLFQGVKVPGGATGAVDAALEGGITALISEGEIKGKAGEAVLVHTLGRMPSPRVIIAGLGKQDSFNLNVIRNLMGTALRRARMTGARTVATIVHGAGIAGLETADCAQAIAEGALMGEYRVRKYKSGDDDPSFGEI